MPTKRSITASATSNWEWQLVTATGNVRILEELHNPAEGLIILVLAPKSTLNGKATGFILIIYYKQSSLDFIISLLEVGGKTTS